MDRLSCAVLFLNLPWELQMDSPRHILIYARVNIIQQRERHCRQATSVSVAWAILLVK